MPREDVLEKRVVAFLRDALADRYDHANLRQYDGFHALSDAQIAAVRDFGLRYIYPEWEEHCFQREAFDALLQLLSSPMRLKPLVAVTMKSLWRFGRQLPRAIDAGKEVVNAFDATRNLEQQIVEQLRETPGAGQDDPAQGDILRALRAIPKAHFEAFVDDMVGLMQLLAQRDLLTTGHKVLEDIAGVIKKRSDRYTDIEIAGIDYALTVMQEGMALFDQLDDGAVAAAINTIALVERDWYASAVAGAPEA